MELHEKLWRRLADIAYIKADVSAEVFTEEVEEDNCPAGYDEFADFSSQFIIEICRDRLSLNYNEWNKFIHHIKSQLKFIKRDMDFKDVFGMSLVDLSIEYSDNDDIANIIKRYSQDEVYDLEIYSNDDMLEIDVKYW